MTTLESILLDLYDREINVQIGSFWDCGWEVKIGDAMNGYAAERHFVREEFGQIGEWLVAHANDDPKPSPSALSVAEVRHFAQRTVGQVVGDHKGELMKRLEMVEDVRRLHKQPLLKGKSQPA